MWGVLAQMWVGFGADVVSVGRAVGDTDALHWHAMCPAKCRASMQASAPPNRVCISNETARLVCDADGNVLRANLALECAPADAAAAISLPLPAIVVRIGSDRNMPCAVVAQGGANSWLARDRNAPLACCLAVRARATSDASPT